jgi:hypothetical protein
MKTAMQELIDKLSNSIKFEYRNELVNLLKKEKEQIIKAYNSAIPFKFGEDYYNQTYNPVRDESEDAFKHFADNADITITFNRNS